MYFVPKLCISHFIYFIHLLFYFLLSKLRKFLVFSISGVYNYQDCEQDVGAGINTLMSFSDGLGPSIFCREVEKARPIMEEMDGKVVFFQPESASLTLTC